MEEEILLTKEGQKEKFEELEYLRTVKKIEIAARLKEAVAYGDISENAEYDSAKDEQAEVQDQIAKLENLLKVAKIIEDVGDKGVVRLGQKVTIRKVGSKEKIAYTIVSSSEADPINGKISNVSPVGAALIDKKVKDKVDVKLPNGVASYEVISIG